MTVNKIPKQLNISDYTYHLPDEKIAKYPLAERDSSKLLVFQDNRISETKFTNITNFLSPGDLLVFNNTRVIPARMKFNKNTGAHIEIFCLEPIEPADYALSFQSKTCIWKCIVGNLKKWKTGKLEKQIALGNKTITLFAEKIADYQTSQNIRFSWNDESINFEQIIELSGVTPIPPYLNRESEGLDKIRYQTIYSQVRGSVAAPTAGLHFTENIFTQLTNNGISLAELTLHVGAGTFKPIQTNDVSEHEMHTEFFSVSRKTLELLLKNNRKVFAVGTTTLRSLESIYWLGVKLIEGKIRQNIFELKQWEAYELNQDILFNEALSALLRYCENQSTDIIYAHTQIMILPGYKPKTIKALITNFHQPNSTLLLLVAALVGNNWKSIYDYALSNNFRFLSYGDSSLLFV